MKCNGFLNDGVSMFRRLPAKDLVRNNFPISSAEGPGWQGAFDAVYTDVNKEKATTSGGVSREVTTTVDGAIGSNPRILR